MANSTKNIIILSGAAIAGGWGGSWATARLGAALGLSLGPWGTAAGVMIGALLGTSLAKSMVGDTEDLPDAVSMAESELVAETEPVET